MSDAESESSRPPSIYIPILQDCLRFYNTIKALFIIRCGISTSSILSQSTIKTLVVLMFVKENGKDPMGDLNNVTGGDDDEGEEDDDDEDIQDADEWPYHLGPPARCPGSSSVIGTWGLQLLDAAGFINYEQDDADAYMDPEDRWAKVRNPNISCKRLA